MQYRVPQFIEHKAKILGPLDIQQSLLVGISGGVCFLLYFSIGKDNFMLFVLLASLIGGGALSLAFLKIQGRPLPVIIKNFVNFSIAPRIFLWKRKESPVFMKMELETPKVEEKKEDPFAKNIKRTGNIQQLTKKIDFEK